MSEFTTKLNLTKPTVDEYYDIGIVNENMDIIDHHMYSLQLGTAIPSGANLNDYTTPGVYSIDNAVISTILNCPQKRGYATLVVRKIFTANTGVIQTIYFRGTANAFLLSYSRSMLNATYTWGGWRNENVSTVMPDLASTGIVGDSVTTLNLEGIMPTYQTIMFYHSDAAAIRLTDAPVASGIFVGTKLGNYMFATMYGTNGKIFYWLLRSTGTGKWTEPTAADGLSPATTTA